MKKTLLFLSLLASASFVGCAKKEAVEPVQDQTVTAPAPADTKAPATPAATNAPATEESKEKAK